MLSTQRRMLIVEGLRESRLLTVRELAERLDVSEVTIRRDLELLDQHGEVVRVHGGAMARSPSTSFEPSWDAKVAVRNEAKRKIGEAAARHVQPGETILLDSGTTTMWVAKALAVPCSVVTLDVKVAVELASRSTSDGIQTLIVGGEVRSGLFSTTGHFALEMLAQLHVDRAFLSADAVDIEAGITNATVQGTGIKKALIAAATEVILVADTSKVGLVALAKVADLDRIDLWITDDGLDPETLERIRNIGVRVEVV